MNHLARTKPLSDPKNREENSAAWLDTERENMHRQMLSAVSHDLKTPLASVIGSLEVMERMKDRLSPDKQKELLAVALQEAYRLDAFVTNILDMAKLENGAVKPQREKADCDTVIRQSLLKMGRRLIASTVQVKAESGAVTCETDTVLLGRVLNLLLDNAVKYGGDRPEITIIFGQTATEAYIKVCDEGEGIPPDKIDTIFWKYTRISKQDNQIAGTGLGLAISKAIINLLGGTISAANNPDKGSTFTLLFPLKRTA